MALSGVADQVGRVLAGRYRLLAPIGTGASGRVYVADDVHLRRRVAVKVLHAALADDAGFLRRFLTEAQLAGSLTHPNITRVYDWGNDEVPFMVLELLEGGSLRAMLDEDHRLSPSQAARVGAQVALALEFAHSRGLIHRDVKPANLLFDEHGIVRVADFGLARALAEASWTEPAGAVLGTARYAAPEHAGAFPLDGRADLYALALVLVESVTGRVPFVGETPLGTLAARARGGVIASPQLGPLGAVVERAGKADPADRYPDAATMASALGDVEDALPPASPLVLVGLGSAGEDPNPTALPRSRRLVFDQDASDADIEVLDDLEIIEIEPERRSRSWSALVVTAVVTVAVLAAGFAFARASGGATAVPNVVGMSVDDATARVQEVGLGVDTVTREDRALAGSIIEQRPPPGRWLSDTDDVVLVVSAGPKPVSVPDVATQPVDVAEAALTELGFVVEIAPTHDENVPEGIVIATDPAGEASPDSKITLVVSSGPAPRVVPSGLAGGSYEAAAAALGEVGLQAVRADQFSDAVPAGEVMGTDPGPGAEVPRDGPVQVNVSKGPDVVAVPSVVGVAIEAASQALEGAGFDVFVQGNYTPGGLVLAIDPPAGTSLRRGSTVRVLM